MVRVLITLEPRMYREAIALALRRSRPDSRGAARGGGVPERAGA